MNGIPVLILPPDAVADSSQQNQADDGHYHTACCNGSDCLNTWTHAGMGNSTGGSDIDR